MSAAKAIYVKPGPQRGHGKRPRLARGPDSNPGASAGRSSRIAACAAALSAALITPGCGSFSVTNYLPKFLQPYRPDVQQGNVITSEMVDQLKPGITRDQVKFMLGTPLLTDSFHPDRWDYLYYLNPRKGTPQRRSLVIYFADNRLDHFTSDPMPPESMADNLILGKKSFTQPSATPKEPAPPAAPKISDE